MAGKGAEFPFTIHSGNFRIHYHQKKDNSVASWVLNDSQLERAQFIRTAAECSPTEQSTHTEEAFSTSSQAGRGKRDEATDLRGGSGILSGFHRTIQWLLNTSQSICAFQAIIDSLHTHRTVHKEGHLFGVCYISSAWILAR